jgi:hypothetical protein
VRVKMTGGVREGKKPKERERGGRVVYCRIKP